MTQTVVLPERGIPVLPTLETTAPYTGDATSDGIGVYVHFPWCLAKCPYCDFLSVAAERPAIPQRAYTEAVLAELERRLAALPTPKPRLRTVFFGGGTPSLWDPSELGRVLRAILDGFGADGRGEITAECNPSSFDGERAEALSAVGVNRVSIGVQSLDAERLEFLGRLHSPAGGLAAVEAAVRSSVPRVSADLIFGVTGQQPEAAAAEVRRVVDLGVTHVSAYALTVEPGTAFGARARKGHLPLLAEDDVAGSFLAVSDALGALGFSHYEISNFASQGHVAEHNLGYWRGIDYLGLGCGAWGTVRLGDDQVRYRNTPVPERYLSSRGDWGGCDLTTVTPNGLLHTVETLDGEMRLSERLLLGLRTAEGVDLEASARRLGVEAWTDRRLRGVARHTERGTLVRDGARLWIPRDRWLLADGVITDVA